MSRAGSLFLAFIIMFSVLLFGSVEPWAFGLTGIAVTVYFYFGIMVRDARFRGDAEDRHRGPVQLERRAVRRPARKEERRAGCGKLQPWRLPSGVSWRQAMSASAAGFAAIALFAMVPLPAPATAFFSGKGYRLMEALSPGKPAWLCLSMDSHDTMEALLRLAVYAMVFLIAESAGKDRRALRRAFSALCFFGFGLVVFAVIQRSTWDGRLYWLRQIRSGNPFGPFVNRDHFAGFIGMLVPPGLALAIEAGRPGKKALYALLTAGMAAGLFYSLSRGGVVSFFASILFFLFLAIAGKTSTGARTKKSGGAPGGRASRYMGFFAGRAARYMFFFAAALLFYVLYGGVLPLLARFEKGGLGFGTRLKVWEAALRAARDFRWFGTGLGTFREIFPLYNPGLQKTFDFAHNDYVNLLVETGLAGSLFALAFFASFARGVYNYYGRRRPSCFTAGLLASVAYMLVHSFLDFNLHIPSNAITFSAIAGFATARIHAGGRPGADF